MKRNPPSMPAPLLQPTRSVCGTVLLVRAVLFFFLAAHAASAPAAPAALIPGVWMDSRERSLVEKYLGTNKDKVMLEYGSGGSTLHFARLAKQYYSVEHDKPWCDALGRLIDHVGLRNVNYSCVPPDVPRKPNCLVLHDELCPSTYSEFRSYIEAPLKLGARFDVVLVDGRARPQCAVAVVDYLRDNSSVVILHDWNARPKYHLLLQAFDVVELQRESVQPGGGGLVILRPRRPFTFSYYPDWWW